MPSNAANFNEDRLKGYVGYRAQVGKKAKDFTTDGLRVIAKVNAEDLRDLYQGFFSKSNAKLVGMSFDLTLEAEKNADGTFQGDLLDEAGYDVKFAFQSRAYPSLFQYLTIPKVDAQFFNSAGQLDLSVFDDDVARALEHLNEREADESVPPNFVGPELNWAFVYALVDDGRGNPIKMLPTSSQNEVEPGLTTDPGNEPD